MDFRLRFLFCLIAYYYAVTLILTNGTSANDSEMSESDPWTQVDNLLNEHDGSFEVGGDGEFVLLLGMTGAGKSTLASILTNSDLESYEVGDGTCEFAFRDRKERISEGSIIKSKTIVPGLMIEKQTNTKFYDCPGFSDTRGLPYDIINAYYNEKLLNSARKMKIVFVVSANSVKSVGDRIDFMALAEHVNKLITNIENYRDGIGLIVNKVPNEYSSSSGRFIEDIVMIARIENFLKGAKKQLELSIKNIDIAPKDLELNTKVIKLIETLLEKKRGKLSRISIMRLADRSGGIQNMTRLTANKESIMQMINQNLKYITKKDNDFAKTISDKSMTEVNEVFDTTLANLESDVLKMCGAIDEFYAGKENQIKDVLSLRSLMEKGFKTFSKVEYTAPRQFIDQFIGNATTVGIEISTRDLEIPSTNNKITDRVFGILNELRGRDSTIKSQITNKKNECTSFLSKSITWYNLLSQIYDKLSQGDVTMPQNTKEFINAISDNENKGVSASEFNLQNFLSNLQISANEDIKTMYLNPPKLRALKTVLQANSDVEKTCRDGTLTASGQIVRLKDVFRNEYCSDARIIKIFAFDTLIIDTDIRKPGGDIIMIAPIWSVHGNVRINLSGENGEKIVPEKAEEGRNGIPGLPGGSGGHFFGIVDQILNADSLTISADGGNGSPGQHGANGRPGTYANKVCSEATAGTDGGKGGFGGHAGSITILPIREQSPFKTSNEEGRMGMDGEGGLGGKGIQYTVAKTKQRDPTVGEIFGGVASFLTLQIKQGVELVQSKDVQSEETKTVPDAKNGSRGGNTAGINSAQNIGPEDPSPSKQEYKTMAESKTNIFGDKLNNFLNFF